MPAQLPKSLARRLLLLQGVMLVLTFSATGLAIDQVYRRVLMAGVRDRLEQAVLGVGAAVRLDAAGRLNTEVLDDLRAASDPVGGRFLVVRDPDGRVIWQSRPPGREPVQPGALPAGCVTHRAGLGRSGPQRNARPLAPVRPRPHHRRSTGPRPDR